MEELTIEEKAQRYDEAIRRANEIHCARNANSYEIASCEYIFPALKKSDEDEKIRKFLINEVMGHIGMLDLDGDRIVNNVRNNLWKKSLAWLEKQGKQESVTCPICGWKIEKQGEQKPAGVEPKFKVGDKIISTISNIPYYITEVRNGLYLTDVGCVIMFDAQNNFELIKQEPWSEEDEKYFNAIISVIKKNQSSISLEDWDINWLESIKDRVQTQPQQEWSEEDIVAINCAVEALSKDLPSLAASIQRLKSLSPQNSWKPSEGQMQVLKEACVLKKSTATGAVLCELYNDLEKLREVSYDENKINDEKILISAI